MYVFIFIYGYNKFGKEMIYFNMIMVLFVDVKDGFCYLEMFVKAFINKIIWWYVCFRKKRELVYVIVGMSVYEFFIVFFIFVFLIFYGGKKDIKEENKDIKEENC